MDQEKRCGAQLRKKPGRVCQKAIGLGPSGRCRLHGGSSLRGTASPRYIHGRKARYVALPPRMKKYYETALSDPALLELKDEIALVHARTQDLIGRVDSGESGHLWKLLQQSHTTLTKAQDEAEREAAIAAMGDLITRGAADYRAWTELLKTVEQKQRLVESERKRAVELHQTITVEQLTPMMYAIIDFVRRRIQARDGLLEFQQILETFAGVAGVTEEDAPQGSGKPLLH